MIKNNYQIKRKALKSTLADFLYNYLILKRQAVAIMYREEYLKYPSLVVGHWEDKQMPNTYVHYADIAMETLLVDMLPEVEHWRIPFEGKRCVQVFLHYVLADTKTDEFDGREVLGLPFEFSAGGTL